MVTTFLRLCHVVVFYRNRSNLPGVCKAMYSLSLAAYLAVMSGTIEEALALCYMCCLKQSWMVLHSFFSLAFLSFSNTLSISLCPFLFVSFLFYFEVMDVMLKVFASCLYSCHIDFIIYFFVFVLKNFCLFSNWVETIITGCGF